MGIASGVGTNRKRTAVDPTALPTFGKVCFVGASIMNYTFGDVGNLTTRCTDVEAVFAGEGFTGLEIYCHATPGDYIADITTSLSEAMAQHTSDTLFVIHAGGNNISSGRPYPGGSSTFTTDYAALIAQAATRPGSCIISDVSFRDYDDTTADDEAAGSQPYNTNLTKPALAAARGDLVNHAYYDDGTPVTCFYEWSYYRRLRFLSGDNVHPSVPDGENLLRQWFAQRIGPIAKGTGVPAQVDRVELAYRDSLIEAIDPEAGLTLTSSFPVNTTLTTSNLTVASPAVFAFDVTGLDGTGGGIIFEMGASGSGAYVGFLSSGDLVIRGGSGIATPAPTVALVQINDEGAPSGDGTLVWEYDGTGSAVSVRAWWNGILLWEQTSTHTGAWAGSDPGGYLVGPGNYGGAMSGVYYASDANYDMISPLRYYQNQTVSA